jgi:hypothetical protein
MIIIRDINYLTPTEEASSAWLELWTITEGYDDSKKESVSGFEGSRNYFDTGFDSVE